MANELDIRLFGGVRIALDSVSLTDFMSQKVPALLAYLAMNEGPQRRDDLAALLWGEMPEADAKNNLRQAIANLRKLLEPHLLVTRETIEINPSTTLVLDVAAFERALQSQRGSSPLSLSPSLPLPLLRRAPSSYRTQLRSTGGTSWPASSCAMRRRSRSGCWPSGHVIGSLALHALHTLTQLHLDAGAYDRALSDATRLLTLDSWREEAHRQLMLALRAHGPTVRRAGAIQTLSPPVAARARC